MTYTQLVLLRDTLNEANKPNKTNVSLYVDKKVDLDYLENYFSNIIIDVEKNIKRKKIKKGKVIAYPLYIEEVGDNNE